MAGVQALLGEHVFNKADERVNLAEHCAGKVVGLYFSAHWCPPCRGFTPILTEFYKKHHESKNFEIIFLSSDRDEKSFKDYYNEMPWLTLNYKERQIKQDLGSKYGVRGIPALILIEGDSGELITDDARSQIQYDDVEGNNFPYRE